VTDAAKDLKIDPVSVDGLDEVFEVTDKESRASGTGAGTPERTTGTVNSEEPGQPGLETIDAVEIETYISTAEAAKIAGVDSRTIRRWHEQDKIRGQFKKGRLLVAQGDLPVPENEEDVRAEAEEPGTPGTETGTSARVSGTTEEEEPGQPGQDPGHTPAVVFSDFLDRIERLSRENGELKVLLNEQQRQNKELRLLVDSTSKSGWWQRFYSWFMGR